MYAFVRAQATIPGRKPALLMQLAEMEVDPFRICTILALKKIDLEGYEYMLKHDAETLYTKANRKAAKVLLNKYAFCLEMERNYPFMVYSRPYETVEQFKARFRPFGPPNPRRETPYLKALRNIGLPI